MQRFAVDGFSDSEAVLREEVSEKPQKEVRTVREVEQGVYDGDCGGCAGRGGHCSSSSSFVPAKEAERGEKARNVGNRAENGAAADAALGRRRREAETERQRETAREAHKRAAGAREAAEAAREGGREMNARARSECVRRAFCVFCGVGKVNYVFEGCVENGCEVRQKRQNLCYK